MRKKSRYGVTMSVSSLLQKGECGYFFCSLSARSEKRVRERCEGRARRRRKQEVEVQMLGLGPQRWVNKGIDKMNRALLES